MLIHSCLRAYPGTCCQFLLRLPASKRFSAHKGLVSACSQIYFFRIFRDCVHSNCDNAEANQSYFYIRMCLASARTGNCFPFSFPIVFSVHNVFHGFTLSVYTFTTSVQSSLLKGTPVLPCFVHHIMYTKLDRFPFCLFPNLRNDRSVSWLAMNHLYPPPSRL